MDLGEYLYDLNFPSEFRKSLELAQLKEDSFLWKILSERGAANTATENFFDPSMLTAFEKRLGLSLEGEAIRSGKVCFANTDEVRPEFRTTFTAGEFLCYIFALLVQTENLAGKTREIVLPFPEGPEHFWHLVQRGQEEKVS